MTEIRKGQKPIHNLKMHEVLQLDDTVSVLRVPDGWIYEYYADKKPVTAVFVPQVKPLNVYCREG